jgi:hypothetical protein
MEFRSFALRTVFLFLIAAGSLAAQAGAYHGTAGGRFVRIELDGPDEEGILRGSFEMPDVGIERGLRGPMTEADRLRCVVSDWAGVTERADDDTLDLRYISARDSLHGLWLTATGETLAVAARKIAEFTMVERKWEGGEMEIDYPVFTSLALPRRKAINRAMNSFFEREYGEWSGCESSSASPCGIWLGSEIRFFSLDLVSVLFHGESYGGGAHPDQEYLTITVAVEGSEARPVALEDLFLRGGDYRARVIELATNAFTEIGVLGPDDEYDPVEHNLEEFAVSERGLEIYRSENFQPGYHIVIPWDSLRTLIDPRGPAGRFADSGR